MPNNDPAMVVAFVLLGMFLVCVLIFIISPLVGRAVERFATWNRRHPALFLVLFIGVLSIALLFLRVVKAL